MVITTINHSYCSYKPPTFPGRATAPWESPEYTSNSEPGGRFGGGFDRFYGAIVEPVLSGQGLHITIWFNNGKWKTTIYIHLHITMEHHHLYPLIVINNGKTHDFYGPFSMSQTVSHYQRVA